ncbi:hypothetical protein HRbin12_01722 [bacterium HR12]|nr:hypothetical protein HRbin12_01722 [bacterium HR12]
MAEPTPEGLPPVALGIRAVGMVVEARGAFIRGARAERLGARLWWHVLGIGLSAFGGATALATAAGSVDGSGAWVWVGALLGPAIAWYVSGMARRVRERAGPAEAELLARDPGWPLWIGPMLSLEIMLPGRRRRMASRLDLLSMRYLYLAFVLALVLYWFVLSFITEPSSGTRVPEPSPAAGAFAGGVLALGVAVFGLGERVGRRVLRADREELLPRYRTTFFLRVAAAEVPALVAFIGTFITGASWLYPIGLLAALPGFVRAAPSTSNLLRLDAARRREGRLGSLFELVTEPPASSAPGPER